MSFKIGDKVRIKGSSDKVRTIIGTNNKFPLGGKFVTVYYLDWASSVMWHGYELEAP